MRQVFLCARHKHNSQLGRLHQHTGAGDDVRNLCGHGDAENETFQKQEKPHVTISTTCCLGEVTCARAVARKFTVEHTHTQTHKNRHTYTDTHIQTHIYRHTYTVQTHIQTHVKNSSSARAACHCTTHFVIFRGCASKAGAFHLERYTFDENGWVPTTAVHGLSRHKIRIFCKTTYTHARACRRIRWGESFPVI